MFVRISNLYFDCGCGHGYLSAKEAVFILTVLCQQSATKCNKVQQSATKCNKVSVERIYLNIQSFLNICSKVFKMKR